MRTGTSTKSLQCDDIQILKTGFGFTRCNDYSQQRREFSTSCLFRNEYLNYVKRILMLNHCNTQLYFKVKYLVKSEGFKLSHIPVLPSTH